MRILLTNDDGVEAVGIQALRKVLSSIHEVTIVAPDRQKSASGHGITVHKPLRVKEIIYKDAIGFAVNGTPADCVKLALEELLSEKPDLIISGINSGPNLGTDVLYSGTVSAAIEGIISEVPSIAVSLVTEYDNNKDTNSSYLSAAKFVSDLSNSVIENGLTRDTILNINIPDLPEKMIKGFQITKLGTRRYINCVEKRKDPRGKFYYWLGGEIQDIEKDTACIDVLTDIKAVNNGFISITPVHFDLTNYKMISILKKWKLN